MALFLLKEKKNLSLSYHYKSVFYRPRLTTWWRILQSTSSRHRRYESIARQYLFKNGFHNIDTERILFVNIGEVYENFIDFIQRINIIHSKKIQALKCKNIIMKSGGCGPNLISPSISRFPCLDWGQCEPSNRDPTPDPPPKQTHRLQVSLLTLVRQSPNFQYQDVPIHNKLIGKVLINNIFVSFRRLN